MAPGRASIDHWITRVPAIMSWMHRRSSLKINNTSTIPNNGTMPQKNVIQARSNTLGTKPPFCSVLAWTIRMSRAFLPMVWPYFDSRTTCTIGIASSVSKESPPNPSSIAKEITMTATATPNSITSIILVTSRAPLPANRRLWRGAAAAPDNGSPQLEQYEEPSISEAPQFEQNTFAPSSTRRHSLCDQGLLDS